MTGTEIKENGKIILLSLIGIIQCFYQEIKNRKNDESQIVESDDVPFDVGIKLLNGSIDFNEIKEDCREYFHEMIDDIERKSQMKANDIKKKVEDFDIKFHQNSKLVENKIHDIKFNTYQTPSTRKMRIRRSNSYTKSFE